MYIIEGVNGKYCYAIEKVWDKSQKKYNAPNKCIGQSNSEGVFIPNKYLSGLFILETADRSSLSEHELLIIKTVTERYGNDVRN